MWKKITGLKAAVYNAKLWNIALDEASLERYEKALAALEKMTNSPLSKHYETVMFYACILYALDDYKGALEKFKLAIPKIQNSKLKSDNKNFLLSLAAEHVTHIDQSAGGHYDIGALGIEKYDEKNVDRRLRNIFNINPASTVD